MFDGIQVPLSRSVVDNESVKQQYCNNPSHISMQVLYSVFYLNTVIMGPVSSTDSAETIIGCVFFFLEGCNFDFKVDMACWAREELFVHVIFLLSASDGCIVNLWRAKKTLAGSGNMLIIHLATTHNTLVSGMGAPTNVVNTCKAALKSLFPEN